MSTQTAKRINIGHAFAVIGAIVLVGSEIIAAAVAAAWALAGLFKLGDVFFLLFTVVFVGAAVVATYKFARTSFSVEPFFEKK